MKKNYILPVLLFLSILITQATYSQSELVDSKFGATVKNAIDKKKTKYNLSSDDVSDLYINKEVYSKKTKTTQLYINQRYNGVKIFNAISTISLKDGNEVYFANRFKDNVSKKINATTPQVDSNLAIQKAATHFKLNSTTSSNLLKSEDKKEIYSNSGLSQEDIPVELVYFQMPDGSLKLSWNLSILTLDSKHWWSIRVDAVSGDILNVNDWIVSCNFTGDHTKHGVHTTTKKSKEASFNLFKSNNFLVADGSEYTVFPFSIESPNHGSRQIISEPADDIASPFGWHDDDGIAGAEYTDTQGNNVFAQLDDDGNDGTAGLLPDGTASLDFNFALDLNQTASTNQEAAITNLFYMSNIMHDIWYQYGFDVETGAFQEKHYTRVNAAGSGDPVFADAQDGSGLNNANFGTPPDGNSPRMQMYLWETPSTVPLLTINNTALAGGYIAILPSNGVGDDGPGNITRPTDTPITSDIVLVDDGTGDTGEQGCNALTNGAALAGKIAIIRRGSCNFTVKIQNAQDAGAIAVIVANHNNPDNDPDYGEYVNMYGVTDPVFTIPSIFINFTDGDAIITAINNAETVNATIVNDPGILIDGDFDNVVIAHEYGHGISNRLTGGGFNADCLQNCTEYDAEGNCIGTRPEQMGEGWSDWFGLMITMKSSDLPTDARGIGTYLSSQPIDGGGIRPFRYSPDTGVNPLTYDDTNDTASISAPHGTGSIWCTMLWDLTWKYIEKYGFNPDIYNGTGGNNKLMQIVIDGLKLQPCNPGFVDGRDAILAADMALTGGEDQCMIWEVFAARGLGLNAVQGNTLVRTDQTEDFTMPDPTAPSLANCTTLSTDEINSKSYSVYPNPANNKLTIKARKSLGKVVITLIDINGRKVLSKDASLLSEVELNTSTLQSGLYILNIKGDFINVNEKILIE